MTFKLPELPYAYDSLEPAIDQKTMEIHHTKHHNGYVTKLNAAVEGTEYADQSIEEIIKNLKSLPSDIQTAVRNNGGGHYNHSLFWESLQAPKEDNKPSGDLAKKIDEDFGSFEKFQEEFTKAATGQFGSGWGWLVKEGEKLKVLGTPNQDNPLTEGLTPLLGLDVWEHAYYLNYQNRRPDYVKAFWSIVNWDKVAERFSA
ncbi:superoxide dismutase [Facklamia sp. 7083-14-GEN3]|uniref:superoxide dismutase n=1 Tax=Facklamia sp. 7083-14-GEN3 TaxID=2973478 RepID=UPI00215CC590|nr:superoxide dismutase [Facklamia sp. 7083-14-GEN3]MCR8969255.1 superoxide dismutase [Facklamia sp. 7083-14-GEN3]